MSGIDLDRQRCDSPRLGGSRGTLSDWVTQRWVGVTGRRIDLDSHEWLRGPYAGPDRVGRDLFDRWAEERGFAVRRGDADRDVLGLMARFDDLAGPGFDPRDVAPAVRDFYERTSAYRLDLWSEWATAFRPFGSALAWLFSRRLEQLNIPLSGLATARGMTSEIVHLQDPESAEVRLTGWVRTNVGSGETVYVGAYSIVEIPGREAPCVRVVFPLPNGSATVILSARSPGDGSLVLESSGHQFGDPGFYFVVVEADGRARARTVRTFRETIRVYEDPRDGELRTDHEFSIWRRTFLRLHYRMTRKVASP